MPLRLPFVPPFDAVTYPVAEPYQASNPDPAAWRLRIADERPASDTLNLIACCDAVLSTIPPATEKKAGLNPNVAASSSQV